MKRVVLAGSILTTLLFLAWHISYDRSLANRPDTSWSPPELALSGQEVSLTLVDLARGPGGIIHLLAVEWVAFPNANLLYAWRDSSGKWSTPEVVTQYTSYYPDWDLLVTADGVAHVIWSHDPGGGNRHVYYAQRNLSGSWSTPEPLSDTAHDEYGLTLATVADNQIVAAWFSLEVAGLFLRYQQAGGWSDIEQVDSGIGSPQGFEAKRDSKGNLHFFWADVSGSVAVGGAYHRLFSSTYTWGPETRISDDLAGPSLFVTRVSAAVEGDHLYLVWTQQDTQAKANLHFAENMGAGWSDPIQLNSRPGLWYVASVHATMGNVAVIGGLAYSVTVWTRYSDTVWLEEPLDFLVSQPMAASWADTLHLVWSDPGGPLEYSWRGRQSAWFPVKSIDDNVQQVALQAEGASLDLAWGKNNNIYYSQAEIISPVVAYFPTLFR